MGTPQLGTGGVFDGCLPIGRHFWDDWKPWWRPRIGTRPLTLSLSGPRTSHQLGRGFQRDLARRKELIDQHKAGGGAAALNPWG